MLHRREPEPVPGRHRPGCLPVPARADSQTPAAGASSGTTGIPSCTATPGSASTIRTTAISLIGRSYNSFLFANLMYDITKKFTMGFEVTYWKTSYMEQRAGLVPPSQLGPTEQANSVVFDWMCKYAF